MRSAEAVAAVEHWLAEAYGPGSGLRVDRAHVVRTPEGWAVPYNNAEFVATGKIDNAIFPVPRLIVTEPAGELRFGGPYPGQYSLPISYPGRERWDEIGDPEFAAAGIDRFGVPVAAITGWRKHAADGSPTGEVRPNPKYRTGPLRCGLARTENPLETLLAFHNRGWLDERALAIGLVESDGFVSATASDSGPLRVYTSTRWGGTRWADLLTLVESRTPAPAVQLCGPPDYQVRIEGAAILAAAAEFPRYAPRIDQPLASFAAQNEQLARELAGQLGLPEPVAVLPTGLDNARRLHLELTTDEARACVQGRSWVRRNELIRPPVWPADLAANGLVAGRFGPRADSFGKWTDTLLDTHNLAWHRIAGAFTGFALGEALAGEFTAPRPLTARLTELTDAFIRSDLDYTDEVGPLTAALAALVPAGGPEDGALGLIGGLLGVIPLIHRNPPVNYGGSGPVARLFAAHFGLTGEAEQTAAEYTGLLFEHLLTNEFSTQRRDGGRISAPLWFASHQALEHRTGVAFAEIRALAEQALIKIPPAGLPWIPEPGRIGDGRSPLSVLGRALAAVSGFENQPAEALSRAIAGSVGNPLIPALAGAFVGARTGIAGLPSDLLARLDSRYVIEDLATDAVRKVDEDPARYGTVREQWLRRYPPVPGGEIAAGLRADRLRGCLLGGAIGDALGAPVEFVSVKKIAAQYGPDLVTRFVENPEGRGWITDDTQMTLFTAEALIRAHAQERRTGAADVRLSLQLAYQRWFHTQDVAWADARGPLLNTAGPDGWLITNRELFHARAPGVTVSVSLQDYARTGEFGTFEHKLNDSKGCGGVMRAAPIAVWSADRAEVFRLAAVSAALTHSHPTGYLSAGVLAVLVHQLIDGTPLTNAVDTAKAELTGWPGHEELLTAMEAAISLAAQGDPTPEKVETLGRGARAESTLAIALYAALVTEDPEEALLISVNHGGDSDSTGAVCGNILGARFGDVWGRWKKNLDQRELVDQVAADLLAEFGAHPPASDAWHERYPSDEPEPAWPAE